MTYYKASDLSAYVGTITASAAGLELSKSWGAPARTFDVFLSHSLRDARLVLGLKQLLEAEGFSVYVDWIDDTDLDRHSVSPETAARLRTRMKASRSLIYATSRHAAKSRWMPWELGYFDGVHGMEAVAVCPIETGESGTFDGQEYVGLYKTLERVRLAGALRPYAVKTSRKQAEPISSFVAGRGAFVGLTSS